MTSVSETETSGLALWNTSAARRQAAAHARRWHARQRTRTQVGAATWAAVPAPDPPVSLTCCRGQDCQHSAHCPEEREHRVDAVPERVHGCPWLARPAVAETGRCTGAVGLPRSGLDRRVWHSAARCMPHGHLSPQRSEGGSQAGPVTTPTTCPAVHAWPNRAPKKFLGSVCQHPRHSRLLVPG